MSSAPRQASAAWSRLRREAACLLIAILVAALPGRVIAADLVVEVREVASNDGLVRVALCTSETFLQPRCPHAAAVGAARGTASVTLRGVPPGRWALQAFHDENSNGEIDRNLIGWPTEGIGFGNDAAMRFGPPTFDDAVVALDEPSSRTTVRLRYLSRR